MASATIGNLAVSLTMSTAAFQKGATLAEKRTQAMRGRFNEASVSVKNLGAALGVALGADALYNVVSGAFEMASSLSEAAERAGVTVEALQELRFAAEQTGVSNEKLEASLVRMQRSIGDLGLGVPAATRAFEALGLSAEQLRGLSPDESFRLIAESLSNVRDKAQQAALGQQIFGRGFAQLLPIINGGKEGLDAYAEASRRNGQISTEDAAKLDELADNWGKMKNAVLVATANILAAAIPMAEKIGAFLDSTRMSVHNFRESVIAMARDAVEAVRNMVTGIQQWITGTLNGIWQSAIDKIKAVEATFRWMYDKVVGHSWVPDMVHRIGYEMATLSQTMAGQAEAVAVRVEKSFKDMADATLSSLSRLSSAIRSGGFLGILEAVIGLGLQLGSIGVFGKGVAARINASSSGGFVSPPRSSSKGGSTIQVVPSPYFDVVVDGRVMQAAPSIARAGAQGGVTLMGRKHERRLA